MFTHKHHTPCINISQCSRINIIHPSLEPCCNLRCKTIEPCEKPQIEHLHLATTVPFDSLVGDATPVDVMLANVAPPFTLVRAGL